MTLLKGPRNKKKKYIFGPSLKTKTWKKEEQLYDLEESNKN